MAERGAGGGQVTGGIGGVGQGGLAPPGGPSVGSAGLLPPVDGQGSASHQFTTVSFLCQRCLQPVRLDSSLKEISKETYTSMKQRVADNPTEKRGDEGGEGAKATISSPRLARVPTLAVKRVIAPPSEGALWDDTSKTSLHQANQIASLLFETLSSGGELDHPLCDECSDTLLEEIDTRIQQLQEDQHMYTEFLSSTASERERTRERERERGEHSHESERESESEEERVALSAELAQLQQEEEALLSKLHAVDADRLRLEKEERDVVEDMKELDMDEERYWKEYNEYQRQVQDFTEEQASVERKYRNASAQLERLKRTNVFNDAFHIWHDGHFGTINGFRLGRLPSVPVEWSEINAAWGQTLLLLYTMATRLNFAFQRYRLVPNGSFSRLERAEATTHTHTPAQTLPLFYSGGVKLSFGDSRYDVAMVAFLDCLEQLMQHIEARDPHFKLPYRIDGDRIGDVEKGGDSSIHASVKLSGNEEVVWTKALKYMLTNLKWCLAWVCKQMG